MWPCLSFDDRLLVTRLDLSSVDQDCKFMYFDIGSVLIDLHWDIFSKAAANLVSTLKGSYFPPSEVLPSLRDSEVWIPFATGRSGPFEFARGFLKALGVDSNLLDKDPVLALDVKAVSSQIIGSVRPRALRLIREIRSRGIGVGALSNSIPWHEADVEATLRLRDIFDVVLFGQDVGCEKPAPEIYKIAFCAAERWLKKRNGELSPQNICFVDDTPANVRVARDMGWRASLLPLINSPFYEQFLDGSLPDDELRRISTDFRFLIFGDLAAERLEELVLIP
jgi:HAD superfamily hydrolase (TIGR01509 family)